MAHAHVLSRDSITVEVAIWRLAYYLYKENAQLGKCVMETHQPYTIWRSDRATGEAWAALRKNAAVAKMIEEACILERMYWLRSILEVIMYY